MHQQAELRLSGPNSPKSSWLMLYFAVSFIFFVPSVCPLRLAVIVRSQSPAMPSVPVP